MAIIEKVKFENQLIQLAPHDPNEEKNIYTIVIGKNGVGKSRLLAECSKLAIQNLSITTNTIGSSDFDGKVIAASTSPFDKFAPPPRAKDHELQTNYRYIGMKSEGLYPTSSSVSLISSAAKGLLENIIRNRRNFNLIKTFDALKFNPKVEFIFKTSFLRLGRREKTDPREMAVMDLRVIEELAELRAKYDIELDNRYAIQLERMPPSRREQTLWAIRAVSHTATTRKSISISFDFKTNTYSDNENKDERKLIEAIYILLNSGFMRVMDIRLQKQHIGQLSLRMASSGEQCMLTLMLGIAGHISDNSIILIDEPEISLHPKWQEDFIGLLIDAFSNYKKCHFIIATHSPQIISRLKSEHCFITSLADNKIYPAKYFQNRSADFQLAELFDAPGLMNEYISRLTFSLLAKIKNSKSISTENMDDLRKILGLSKNIDDEDPTLELIKSLQEVFKFYANDNKPN